MDNIIYILFVSIFIPIFLMALLVEKKARLPIAFMLVGTFVSVFASEVNGLLANTLGMDMYSVTTAVTPITEELLKALPILYYAVVISDKREKLFTASMATVIGFAILENAFYLLSYPDFNMLSAIIRAFGAGLMHGMCTLLVGVGISFVRKKKKPQRFRSLQNTQKNGHAMAFLRGDHSFSEASGAAGSCASTRASSCT